MRSGSRRQLAGRSRRAALSQCRLLASSCALSSSSKSSASCESRRLWPQFRPCASAALRGWSRIASASRFARSASALARLVAASSARASRGAAAAPSMSARRGVAAVAPGRRHDGGLTAAASAASSRSSVLISSPRRVGLQRAPCGRAGSIQRAVTGDELLVQPRGRGAVEAEAAEQDHARDRVRRLGEAGAGEVVVDEALGDEAAEQPLHDPVLQVEVDDVVVERAGVLEDDRADRRVAPPFPGLLVPLAAAPAACPSCRPRSGPAACRWSSAGSSLDRPAPRLADGVQAARRPSQLERAGDGVAERVLARARATFCERLRAGPAARRSAAAASSCRSRAASSSSSTVCRAVVVEVGPRSMSPSPCSATSAADAAARGARPAGLRAPGRGCPSSSLDRLRLADQHLEDRGPPRAGGRRSSGSRPRGSAGACGRCGRCAAPCGSGSTARRSGTGSSSGSGGSGPRGRRRWRSGCAAGASSGRR